MSRQRRASSVGNIDVGDTRVRSLSTSRTSEDDRRASELRISDLSSIPKTDCEFLSKIWIAFLELNYRHTWLAPLLILVAVHSAYLSSGNYTDSNPLHMFVAVSYQVPGTNQYGKGIKDLTFVGYYMIFFTFLREFCMQAILRPLAERMGFSKNGKLNRFMEQAYSILYYGTSGPFGLYIMYHSDLWLFRTDTMYKTYPDLTNEYLYKVFYLGQAAFWAQQSCILVLQVEKPRKDFKELVLHHIITILLIWLSYVFHFTKMGLAVYITMDVSDFFLAISKTLNYLDSPLQGPSFIIFSGVWIYLRHYVNIVILWSVLTEFRSVGDFRLNFATQQYKCWISLPIVFILILALQIVNAYWLYLIFRVLYRYLFVGVAQDERSDDESEDEDVKIESSKKKTENELGLILETTHTHHQFSPASIHHASIHHASIHHAPPSHRCLFRLISQYLQNWCPFNIEWLVSFQKKKKSFNSFVCSLSMHISTVNREEVHICPGILGIYICMYVCTGGQFRSNYI